MTKPCIICVAITGSVPGKANNPAVPVTLSEQIESTQEAFEAGASIAHCHVRDDQGRPTADAERFARLKEGLERLFGRSVDLVTENNLDNPYFRRRVESERQNLYAR